MHIAGQELIDKGWKYVVELGCDRARKFAHLYNNGWYLPSMLSNGRWTVRIEVIDGELRGAGVYVFCRTRRAAKEITEACSSASPNSFSTELDLRDPKTLGESFLGV